VLLTGIVDDTLLSSACHHLDPPQAYSRQAIQPQLWLHIIDRFTRHPLFCNHAQSSTIKHSNHRLISTTRRVLTAD